MQDALKAHSCALVPTSRGQVIPPTAKRVYLPRIENNHVFWADQSE